MGLIAWIVLIVLAVGWGALIGAFLMNEAWAREIRVHRDRH